MNIGFVFISFMCFCMYIKVWPYFVLFTGDTEWSVQWFSQKKSLILKLYYCVFIFISILSREYVLPEEHH